MIGSTSLAFLSLFVAVVLGFPERGNLKNRLEVMNLRIVGGEPADITEFPHQVFLVAQRLLDSLHCGGTIIHPKFVLTAAHCLERVESPRHVSVYAGSTFKGKGQKIGAAEIMAHPQYDAMTVRNDIAVVKLSEELKFGSTINLIEFAKYNEGLPYGISATAIGWGKTGHLQPGSENLLKASLPVLDPETCHKSLCESYKDTCDKDANAKRICVRSGEQNKNVCSGDSGGPLLHDGKIVGITSFGSSTCDSMYPSAFTRISAYTEFIQAQIEK